MFTPAILHNGPYALSDVIVSVSDSAWAPSASYDVLVQGSWQERVREAASEAHAIWDGQFYRVTNIGDMRDDATPPRLCLGTIPYRFIATFRALHEHHERERLEPLYHLSTAGLIRTRDGQFVFGKRSRNGAIDLIGGGVQSDELAIACGSDIEANLRKEILEELGVRSAQIQSVKGKGILLSTTSNVLVIAAVDLSLSMNEVAAQFADRSDDEMSDLVAVSEGNLSAFLSNMTDYRALIPALMQCPESP
jgi:8-oxo-dGTP pyrophosphatase MutT (NUDIX family)